MYAPEKCAVKLARAKMSDHLTVWEVRIVLAGSFLIFLVTYGDYVIRKIGPIVRSWFGL